MAPTLDLERSHWAEGRVVAGIDEAGRGAWAGPVAAAAVIFPPDLERIAAALAGVDDSKKLTAGRREILEERIRAVAAVGIGMVSAEEIDRLGIVPATLAAMAQAVEALPETVDFLLIDHIPRPLGAWPQARLTGGDGRSLSIAAASIIAKTARDRMMRDYDAIYPGYGFGRHKGYGTAQHRAALDQLGPSPLHRRSWRPLLQSRLPLEDTT